MQVVENLHICLIEDELRDAQPNAGLIGSLLPSIGIGERWRLLAAIGQEPARTVQAAGAQYDQWWQAAVTETERLLVAHDPSAEAGRLAQMNAWLAVVLSDRAADDPGNYDIVWSVEPYFRGLIDMDRDEDPDLAEFKISEAATPNPELFPITEVDTYEIDPDRDIRAEVARFQNLCGLAGHWEFCYGPQEKLIYGALAGTLVGAEYANIKAVAQQPPKILAPETSASTPEASASSPISEIIAAAESNMEEWCACTVALAVAGDPQGLELLAQHKVAGSVLLYPWSRIIRAARPQIWLDMVKLRPPLNLRSPEDVDDCIAAGMSDIGAKLHTQYEQACRVSGSEGTRVQFWMALYQARMNPEQLYDPGQDETLHRLDACVSELGRAMVERSKASTSEIEHIRRILDAIVFFEPTTVTTWHDAATEAQAWATTMRVLQEHGFSPRFWDGYLMKAAKSRMDSLQARASRAGIAARLKDQLNTIVGWKAMNSPRINRPPSPDYL